MWYARQDRKARAGNQSLLNLLQTMIEKAGATRMLTWTYAVQIQGFFDIPVNHLMVPLIADYFIEHGIQGDDVVVVSPDHSGVTRA